MCKPEIKLNCSKTSLTLQSFSFKSGVWLFLKSSYTLRANSEVTLQVAVIIPEDPNFKPSKSLASEPGKIEKFSILISLYRL